MWLKTKFIKPKINEQDQYDKDHKISVRVVVWLDGEIRFSSATYNHLINHWNVEGYLGFKQERVKYFRYIDNPYIEC